MRSKGPIIFIVLALILAGASAWGAHSYLAGQARLSQAKAVRMARVVVASGKLEAGQAIIADMIQVRPWPPDAVPNGSFNSGKVLKGRVLTYPVASGQVILESMLAEKGAKGGLSAVVPSGTRAMTVKVDDVIGVGGYLQPGDRVDVLMSVGSGLFGENPASIVVLSDIPVLTAGEKVKTQGKGGRPKKNKFETVTLQVTPQQSEKLALAASAGKVVLALRNQADQLATETKGVRLTSLLPLPQPPAKPKPKKVAKKQVEAAPVKPKEDDGVVVIKGVTKSVQVL